MIILQITIKVISDPQSIYCQYVMLPSVVRSSQASFENDELADAES
jgi:hypothetical protein